MIGIYLLNIISRALKLYIIIIIIIIIDNAFFILSQNYVDGDTGQSFIIYNPLKKRIR